MFELISYICNYPNVSINDYSNFMRKRRERERKLPRAHTPARHHHLAARYTLTNDRPHRVSTDVTDGERNIQKEIEHVYVQLLIVATKKYLAIYTP